MPRPLAAITGASSGIGMAFARKLAPRYDLLLVARRREALEALASELRAAHGADVAVLTADLADAAQLRTVADRLTAEPHLALLVNNAGFGNRGAFWEADLAVIEGMHRLHVMAIVRLTHAALTVLVAQDRGAVVNVASIAAFAHGAGNASYGATKSWLAALTEGIYLDLEHAGSAVRVQALCPGYTYSEFHDLLGEDRRRLAPASLWSTAEEVVDASLNALKKGTLVVVPGWRYRILVAVFTKFPRWLRLRLEASGA
jgi:short-subunit dehydrogenase